MLLLSIFLPCNAVPPPAHANVPTFAFLST
jgi:hypothetical protein